MNWYGVFPKILNMSLTASVIIVFVLLLRLCLKKVPKMYSYLLWSVVLFRLLCPVSFSAPVSLLGILNTPVVESSVQESVTDEKKDRVMFNAVEYIPLDSVHWEYPEVTIPVPVVGGSISNALNEQLPQSAEQLAAEPLEAPVIIAAYFWLIGICVLLGHGLVSFVKLQRSLVGAVKFRRNIYLADYIHGPFVLGLFRPRIYLPPNLEKREQRYIILHEQYHISRGDHIIKMIAYLALCLHWFNPLVWAAFHLAVKDMEMSCDEAVVRKLGEEIRADYSASLLQLATGQQILFGTPLAFGEGETAGRIKNLARFKRPTVIVTILAAVACLACIIFCVLNPAVSYDFLKMTEQDTVADENLVTYEVDLGYKVGHAVIVAEQWSDGVCISAAPVILTQDMEELQIRMKERKNDGKLVGIDIQIDTDESSGSLLTYFEMPREHSVIGWAFTAYEENAKIKVIPEAEKILAAMAFDEGKGVRAFDCESLVKEPERLENAGQMIVVRAVFREEAVGVVKEEAASLPTEESKTNTSEELENSENQVKVEEILSLAEQKLRTGYEPVSLTYVDNSKVGWDYYEEEPWKTEEQRDALAQAAMQELYTLTGYQIEECVYTTDGRSKFIFGKSEEYIRKCIAFYTRDYGFTLAGDQVPWQGFVNARRAHYSDVQQLDSPYHNKEYSGHAAIPTWFLEQSGVYQGEKIIGFEAINLDDTVYTHIKLNFDGGYYLVVMDEKIESVHEVSGPYAE